MARRLVRLILVMALALYWAVSIGMWDRAQNTAPAEKKDRAKRPKKLPESLTTFFERGSRRIRACLQSPIPLPPLWSVWSS